MFGQACRLVHSAAPGRGRTRAWTRAALLGSVWALALAPSSIANPTGGVVVAGDASIGGQGTPHTTIDQTSDRAVINWDAFSIAADGLVAFNQPGASSITLNRVVGADPSNILGQLTANGRIVLVNPNGVLFGAGSRIDAAGIIATTHDIANDQFMAGGPLGFDRSSGANGYVINEGLITVEEAGLAAFVAPHVRNSGVISARLGHVELASASKFTVDFYGDDLITFPIDSALLSAPVGPDGASPRALVVNDGSVLAEGGSILMTASAARGVVDDVILAGGELVATSFTNEGGAIVLRGEGGGVFADGSLDASGATAGGAISVAGDWVSVGGALTANGASGGTIDIAAGGLSLAGSLSATGASGAGGAVSIDVAGSTVENSSASIDVSGASGGSIRNLAAHQITSSASYDASGASGAGGQIDVSAGAVKLLSASLDASGASGGRVRLGGEFQGGAGLAADELPNASVLAVSSGSAIDVSAHGAGGAGGQAIVWSDADTMFLGSVDARPGAGGAGGFIEVSSSGVLNFNGDLQTGGGQVLLDPKNLTIVPDGYSQLALILGYNYPGVAGDPLTTGGDALANGDFFGSAVSLDGLRLAVGAAGGDVGGGDAGGVYLFTFSDESFSSPVLHSVIGEGFTGANNVALDLNADWAFGSAVSLDGTQLAVGAPGAGVSGSPTATGNGAVYLFTFTDDALSGGQLAATIGAGFTGGNNLNVPVSALDHFGTAVSLDGDRLAVGAPGDDGPINDGGAQQTGAVYLVTFANSAFSTPTLQGIIGEGYGGVDDPTPRPKDVDLSAFLDVGDALGSSVSLDGTLLVVGAIGDDGSTNVDIDAGAAYLLSFDTLDFSNGVREGTIGRGYAGAKDIDVATHVDADDLFGSAVSLSGDRLAIGALQADGSGDGNFNSGEVHLFSFSGADFLGGSHTGKLGSGYTGANDFDLSANLGGNDSFGIAVSLDGDRLAVGATEDDGDGNPPGVANTGAVYLFDLRLGSPTTTAPGFTDNAGGDSFMTVSSLLALLNGGNNVTLQATNDLTVAAGFTVAGGAGGSLTLEAGRSVLVNASIDTDDADLTLIANQALPAGHEIHRDAGPAHIAMANGVTIDTGAGAFLATIQNGPGETGDLTLDAITAASITAEHLGAGNVIINGVLDATNSVVTDSIVLAATNGNFVNSFGPDALLPGAGRFVVYSADPALNTIGGLVGSPYYNTAYGGAVPASGDIFAYTLAPVLTVTPDAAFRVYGDPDDPFGFNVSGLINGDTQAGALTGDPGYLPPALNAGVGPYTFPLQLGTLQSPYNYTIVLADGSFTVTARPITVTADPGQSKVYGDPEPGLTYSVNPGGLVFGDVLTGALERNPGENVALYDILQGTLDAGPNYTITYVGDQFAITPRPITVTVDPSQSKVYGDAEPGLTYQITLGDLVPGDILAGSLARDPGEVVALYDILQGTLDAGANYALTFVGDQFEITPRPITVTADPGQSKVYGGLEPLLTYQITLGDLVPGDALTGSLVRDPGEAVALYDILLGTLDAGPNYALTYVGDQFAITSRAITITVDPGQSKVYGDADPGLTYQITSGDLVPGDVILGALDRDPGEVVDLYDVLLGTIDVGPNYTLTFVGDQFAITSRPITVTVDPNQSKIYGDVDPALTYQLTSGTLAFSDVFSGSLVRAPGENVASDYAIGQGSLGVNSNYDLTFVGDQFAITPRPITVTADDQVKVYGSTDPILSYQITSGDLAFSDAFAGSLDRAPGETVGGYAISQGSLTLGVNYDLTYVDGTLTINPAALLITPDDASRVYGDDNPTFTASFSGLVAGDGPGVVSGLSFATPATASSNVGVYDIVASGGTATNYVISYANPGELTVNPAPLTVTVHDVERFQGEPNPVFSATITGFKLGEGPGVLTGLVLASSATDTSPPGLYAITSSGGAATNYVIAQRNDGTLSVLNTAEVLNALTQTQNDVEGQPQSGIEGPAGADTAAFLFAATGGADTEGEDADPALGLICTLADERECPMSDSGAE